MPTPNLANVLTNKTALEEVQAGIITQSVQSAAAVSPSNVAQPAAPVVQIQKAETALAAEPIKIKESALTPPVYQFSDKIFISEFLADPAGNDDEEWIELFNDGVEPVNLLGWSLDDAEGGSPMYVIKEPIVVGGKDFWVFKKEKTGLVLNNSTDSVVLRDPAGKEISRFDYKNPKEGFSFAKFSDGWQETSILTPGAMNQKSALQVAQFSSTPANVKAALAVKKPALVRKISPAEAKTMALGSEVIISGAVIVPPNVFGKSIAYLDGLQIYFNKAEWPALAVGEVISARGTISESAGERRLIVKNANDIKKTGKTELLMPLEITALEMTGELAGKLVQLNGTLVEKKANKLIVADDSAEAVVYLKTATKMDSKIYKLENVLKVQGVVGNFNGEWRIMPRSKNDIVNLSAAKLDLPSSSSVPEKSGRGIGRTGTFIVLILLFVAIAGVNIYLAIVHRKVIMGLLRRFTPR
jgi:DNA/RNA endonuclease YhcR with UshA esterase domain